MNIETKCLVKECKRMSKQRGLCTSCYLSALKLIKIGKTTDDELVNRGMINPKKEQGTLFEKQFYGF